MPTAPIAGPATFSGKRAIRYASTRLNVTWNAIANASGAPKRSTSHASGPSRMRRVCGAKTSIVPEVSRRSDGDGDGDAACAAVLGADAAFMDPSRLPWHARHLG